MQKITCLLIDDDVDDHEIFMDLIEGISSSIKYLAAYNGKEGIERLVSNEIKPDLIFLDLNMPLMDGRQFLKEFKKHEHLRDIPVVILTTSSSEQNKEEARRLGADDFITKPNKVAEWESSLKKVFDFFFRDLI